MEDRLRKGEEKGEDKGERIRGRQPESRHDWVEDRVGLQYHEIMTAMLQSM